MYGRKKILFHYGLFMDDYGFRARDAPNSRADNIEHSDECALLSWTRELSLKGKERSATFKHDEVYHVGEVLRVMDDEQNVRTRDDASTRFGRDVSGRSRPRLEIVSSCTESEPATSVVDFVSRHRGLERGGMSKDTLPFPLSAFPTAAEISPLDENIQEAVFGRIEILGHLGYELRVFRPTRRTRRPP